MKFLIKESFHWPEINASGHNGIIFGGYLNYVSIYLFHLLEEVALRLIPFHCIQDQRLRQGFGATRFSNDKQRDSVFDTYYHHEYILFQCLVLCNDCLGFWVHNLLNKQVLASAT